MTRMHVWLGAVSVAAIAATPAIGQDDSVATGQVATGQAVTDPVPPAEPVEAVEGEVVVTGIRQSLQRAADIKRSAVQVVDSIVAQDIGKFPDPTTAAALQRVPGVQVQYDKSNELGNVRVRGLPDVLTTVNGREVFSTTGRSFNLQDLPAEALARVDVVKSQTADLIEGGLAGTIDLQLNKPFNFTKPTVVLSGRLVYGRQVDDLSGQVGALLTDRWDTGAGEMGLLVNATWTKSNTYQPESTQADPRTTATAPLNTGAANYIFPSIFQNITQSGDIERKQFNATYQWQVTPELQFSLEGFYTNTKNDVSYSGGGNVQPYTTGTKISNIVASTDDCYTARFNGSGQNARILIDPNGRPYIENPANLNNSATPVGYTVKNLCFVRSATLNNVVINQTTHADNYETTNKSIAGGLKWQRDRSRATLDIAYQTSRNFDESVTADVGQRLPTVYVETDVDGGPRLTIPGDELMRRDTLYVRNSISQDYRKASGHLFAATLKGQQEFDSFIKKVDFGVRFANRAAEFQQFRAITAIPFGNLGTANENGNANLPPARRVVDIPALPFDFLEFGPPAPAINGGQRFLVPSVAFLRSERGRDILRGIFGLPQGTPPFDPARQFDAREKSYSAYGQATYEIPLSDTLSIDGVVGARIVKTDRKLTTFDAVTSGGVATVTPVQSGNSVTQFLPNASARVDFHNGLQARFAYARTIRRPDFTLLNPTLILTLSPNPFLVNTGSAGNPDLKPQRSDSFDASLEYYFRGGYLAVTGYYRDIADRVITAPASEEYGGNIYSVSRPRNLGSAKLQGIEVSGQYFLDWLPGALSGFGVYGAFTYADSEIRGSDVLAGNPLQGVSKYNYTAGLLYDKFGLSGRLVYTYRSASWLDDATGGLALRPIDPDRANEPYVQPLFRWQRPNGRVDFSLGYDFNEHLRVDVGGTNILREKNKTYWGVGFANSQVFQIETTYSVGMRVRF